jgi:hypothetical protein
LPSTDRPVVGRVGRIRWARRRFRPWRFRRFGRFRRLGRFIWFFSRMILGARPIGRRLRIFS